MTHIEILPAPDLYAVEFIFPRHLGITVVIPATCAPMARLEAWPLFPEYKRSASKTSVCNVEYVEIDWETGRCFVKKRQRRGSVPVLLDGEPKQKPKKTRRSNTLGDVRPDSLATGFWRHRAGVVDTDVACELGHSGSSGLYGTKARFSCHRNRPGFAQPCRALWISPSRTALEFNDCRHRSSRSMR
jgi:hypothetical protein